MQPETLQLPDGLQLPAIALPPQAAPAWAGSRLRRRLQRRAVIAATIFTLVLLGSVFEFGSITRPYWGGFISVPAVVTSQHPYYSRGDHCGLGLQFTLHGLQHTATFDPASTCAGMPAPQTTVTASVDPSDPSHVLIVGLDSFQRNLPYIFAFTDAIWLSMAGAFLWLTTSTYRSAQTLTSTEQWRQLTPTIRQRTMYKSTTQLTLQAPDKSGTPQIFQLSYPGRGPWPTLPIPGKAMNLWILADGGGHVLLSGPDCKNATAGTAHVPNSFELRTMGI
ncbi:hypothetical protein QO003_000905 [Arthrobacter silviterrae]|uniref:Uncharacterized protein n=2 Tax=Arthrobacter silviterrae TaxID=2026658 RepID=A0ABX0DDV2_9MICC|nr:hypothetical protein [Arthrobacter silviterrae]MDQ0276602.1 hypothetical protein [Arthrobacter silviterrae]NGN84781.1 hypothetical protein [Arthrobacter silviterrae]